MNTPCPTQGRSGTFSGFCVVISSTYFWGGAQGRNRTTDTAIFSRMLYQLSYLGVLRDPRANEPAGYSGVGRLCKPRFIGGF